MSISKEQIKTNVKSYIAKTFYFNDSSFSIDDNTSFLETGIIDSTGILELINFIQDEFSVKVNDDEMLPENLDSLENIAAYLGKKLSAS
jgi:acyl carrier protein